MEGFFAWIESWPLSQEIATSVWLFPAVESLEGCGANRPHRLHDRLQYTRESDAGWKVEGLYP